MNDDQWNRISQGIFDLKEENRRLKLENRKLNGDISNLNQTCCDQFEEIQALKAQVNELTANQAPTANQSGNQSYNIAANQSFNIETNHSFTIAANQSFNHPANNEYEFDLYLDIFFKEPLYIFDYCRPEEDRNIRFDRENIEFNARDSTSHAGTQVLKKFKKI